MSDDAIGITRMTRTEIVSAIRASARLEGTFRLRSGALATEYFDKYRFESEPRLLRRAGR
jgi:orotate phosphoribosyltransferase